MYIHEVLSCYEEVKARLSQPVPPEYVRIMAGKDILGYVKKDIAMKLVCTTSDFRLTDVLTMSDECMGTVADRTAAICKAAGILDGMGLLPSNISPEMVDVRLSLHDKRPFCHAPRNVVRVLGLMTLSVRLNAYDEKCQLVMAKRVSSKPIGGGKWDSLAAGLLKASEEPKQALYRELFEEAGLMVPDVSFSEGARFVQQIAAPEGVVREIVMTYDGHLKPGVELRNRDGSVEAFKAVTLPEAIRMVEYDEVMFAAAIGLCESAARAMDKRIEEKWLHYAGQIII